MSRIFDSGAHPCQPRPKKSARKPWSSTGCAGAQRSCLQIAYPRPTIPIRSAVSGLRRHFFSKSISKPAPRQTEHLDGAMVLNERVHEKAFGRARGRAPFVPAKGIADPAALGGFQDGFVKAQGPRRAAVGARRPGRGRLPVRNAAGAPTDPAKGYIQ